MAWAAHDCPLGRPRPRRSDGVARTDRAGVSWRFHDSRTKNHPISEPASLHSRPARHPEGNRPRRSAMKISLSRRIASEFLGTAFLVAAVVGSGIMGDRLAGGNVALALLANTLATGAALVALLLTFGPISGAHLNPAVPLADASRGGPGWRDVPGDLGAQSAG